MNAQRRKALSELEVKISAAKDTLETCKDDLEMLRDEEQEYYDNMSESLQGGEKGDIAQGAISNMESAIENLDTAIDSADEAGAEINEIVEA